MVGPTIKKGIGDYIVEHSSEYIFPWYGTRLAFSRCSVVVLARFRRRGGGLVVVTGNCCSEVDSTEGRTWYLY